MRMSEIFENIIPNNNYHQDLPNFNCYFGYLDMISNNIFAHSLLFLRLVSWLWIFLKSQSIKKVVTKTEFLKFHSSTCLKSLMVLTTQKQETAVESNINWPDCPNFWSYIWKDSPTIIFTSRRTQPLSISH